MTSPAFEGRPHFLYGWLGAPSVLSHRVSGDMIWLETRGGPVQLPLGTVTLRRSGEWVVLNKVTLDTPQGSYAIGGVDHATADALVQAVTEAQRRHRLRELLERDWIQFESAQAAWTTFTGTDRYLSHAELSEWRLSFPALSLPTAADTDLVAGLEPARREVVATLMRITPDLRAAVDLRNRRWVETELQRYAAFFDGLERFPLTPAQREAVLCDEDHTLVLAGAGTGKTSTIMAKVGYLLHKGLAGAEEILLLAFTRKAAEEMERRIQAKWNVPVSVRTFHSLGVEILAQAEGKKPSLCAAAEDEVQKREMLGGLLHELLREHGFFASYLSFSTLLRAPYRPACEFSTEREYQKYLIDVEPRCLTGLRLRSYEECEIANWLTLHDIRFEYEAPYPVDTATVEHRQYRPDFFLPDWGLYIEHWGTGREGNTAPFVDRVRYREKMEWARATHAEHETVLLETYSWERQEGILLTRLEAQLREHGVKIGHRSFDEALKTLNEKGLIDPFVALTVTFLSLFKSGGHSVPALLPRAPLARNPQRAELFLQLFERVHAAYEARLRERGEIDFDDMIARAAEHVASGAYRSPFRYLLIDEFQDISQGRARLVWGLRDQRPGTRVFCVGDDWQSIYRFTGSDLSLMTRFAERWGYTRTIPLDRTFRFDDRLAAFSSRFVLRNPAQLQKSLTTHATGQRPAVAVRMRRDEDDPVVRILQEIAAEAPAAAVFVLNRYRKQFSSEYQAHLTGRCPTLRLEFDTAHGSKGLEADYVVVDNLRQGRYGFPSEIVDDPLLDLVLATPDLYPHAEERRLFYVAVTRARRRVYLVGDSARPSPFIREILEDEGYEAIKEEGVGPLPETCPACRHGELQRRDGARGVFYGCSLYPLCEYAEDPCSRCRKGRVVRMGNATRCRTCGDEAEMCPRCHEGRLVRKTNRRTGAAFYGCSRYRADSGGCRYTRDVPAAPDHLII